MKVSPSTIKRTLKIDLKMKVLKRAKRHMLKLPQEAARVKKCRALLKRYAKKRRHLSCLQMRKSSPLKNISINQMIRFMPNLSKNYR